jgi:hypothetical protein
MKKLILTLVMLASWGMAQTPLQFVLPLMVLISVGLAQTPSPTPDI